MVIKNLTKKVIVSSVMASSLFVLPHFGAHANHASAATATISTTQQVLTVGSTGSSVTAVQVRLKELGYFSYSVDGIYGNLTKGAVIKFQSANHLATDGIAGPNTLGKMFGSSPVPAVTATTTATHTATIASTSPSTSVQTVTSSVASYQTALKKLGYYNDVVDGISGPHTRAAVMAFQSANHLAVDGIVGPHTLAVLNSSSAVAASSSSATASVLSTSDTQALVDSIISDAKALQGVPYHYGGTTTSGFDCSGFTSYVFAKNGITLPRTSAEQYAQGSPTTLVPGALVFFSTVTSGVSHVGIYIGNNEFISATSSGGVRIDSMDNSYWKPRYLGAKTYIK